MNSKISCCRFVNFRSTTAPPPFRCDGIAVYRTCVRRVREGADGINPGPDSAENRLYTAHPVRACGGIGRRARLRALSGVSRVGVRVSLGALKDLQSRLFGRMHTLAVATRWQPRSRPASHLGADHKTPANRGFSGEEPQPR